jgi:hypothetical protein
MAAQRYSLAPPPAGRGGRPNKPRFLTMWETEGRDVNELQVRLDEAAKAGKVTAPPIDAGHLGVHVLEADHALHHEGRLRALKQPP